MTAPGSPASFDALLDELAEDDSERSTMRRALYLMAYSVPQVEPPAGLRERVLARAATAPATFEQDGSYFARSAGLPWTGLAPGVELKDLHAEPSRGTRTTLIRMAPNTPFPPHPHGFIEDLYVIEGDAWVGDVYMATGDYCRAPAGTEHNHVRSGAAGTLALVVSR
ncbi:MAG: cupin domain-containing protein [bacterium]